MRQTGLHLVRFRIPVLRWPTLDHIGDVHVGTLHADGVNHLRQKLARRAHERTAQPVLVPPRPLAHEHDVRPGIALARHHVGATGAQATAFAV